MRDYAVVLLRDRTTYVIEVAEERCKAADPSQAREIALGSPTLAWAPLADPAAEVGNVRVADIIPIEAP